MDAITDLINTGVFESELTEGTYNASEAENEVTPKNVRYNANTSFTPKKRKQFCFFLISLSQEKKLNITFAHDTQFLFYNLNVLYEQRFWQKNRAQQLRIDQMI